MGLPEKFSCVPDIAEDSHCSTSDFKKKNKQTTQ